MEYRRSSHAVFGLQYHIVLVTKYRRKCISGEIGERLKKEIVRLIEGHEGHVISIEAVEDHVHILAELSPRYAVSNEIATIKTVTARLLRRDYEDYLKQFLCGDSFWSRSYFVATSGGGDFGCPEGIRGNTEQKAGTPVWNKKEKMIFVRFLL